MRLDRKGVVGLPLRLAMTFLILSISVPAVMYMVDDLQEDSDLSLLRYESTRLSDTMTTAYYSGEGSVQTISVSIKYNSSLVIGGEGKDAFCISILVDNQEKEKHYLERPSVRILNEQLHISGNRTLQCRCVSVDGVYGVEVTVIA